jgi:hypothetical protein
MALTTLTMNDFLYPTKDPDEVGALLWEAQRKIVLGWTAKEAAVAQVEMQRLVDASLAAHREYLATVQADLQAKTVTLDHLRQAREVQVTAVLPRIFPLTADDLSPDILDDADDED